MTCVVSVRRRTLIALMTIFSMHCQLPYGANIAEQSLQIIGVSECQLTPTRLLVPGTGCYWRTLYFSSSVTKILDNQCPSSRDMNARLCVLSVSGAVY